MANNFISEQDLRRYMKDRVSFHAALSANDYFMPDLKKSSFVTCDLMYDIYYKRCYFPMCSFLKIRPCLHPPNSKQLAELIYELIEEGHIAITRMRSGKLRSNTERMRWDLR